MDAAYRRAEFLPAKNFVPRLLNGNVFSVDMEDRLDQVYGNLHVRARNSTASDWIITLTHMMTSDQVKGLIIQREINVQKFIVKPGCDVLYNSTVWSTWRPDPVTCRSQEVAMHGPMAGQAGLLDLVGRPSQRLVRYKFYMDMFKIDSKNPSVFLDPITEEVEVQVLLPLGELDGSEMRCIIAEPIVTPYRRPIEAVAMLKGYWPKTGQVG